MELHIRFVLGGLLSAVFVGPVSAECLTRQISGVDGDKVQTVEILATSTQANELQAKGYRSATCLADTASRQSYINGICKVAAEGNSAVQLRLELVFGDAPRSLCTTAQELTGLKYAGDPANEKTQDESSDNSGAENATPDAAQTPSQ